MHARPFRQSRLPEQPAGPPTASGSSFRSLGSLLSLLPLLSDFSFLATFLGGMAPSFPSSLDSGGSVRPPHWTNPAVIAGRRALHGGWAADG